MAHMFGTDMTNPDLENQLAKVSLQAETGHDHAIRASVAQEIFTTSKKLRTWLPFLRPCMPNYAVTGRAQASHIEKPAHEPVRSNLARLRSHIYELVKLRRIKLEPTDGYTTHSFNTLTRPIPVGSVFFSARALITLRLLYRSMILLLAGYLFIFNLLIPCLWMCLTPLALLFERRGIHGIGRVGIPTVQQLWSFHRFPQRFWEIAASKLLLRRRTAGLWWYIYLLIADISDFEKNFLNAWSLQRPQTSARHEAHPGSTTKIDEVTVEKNVNLDSIDITEIDVMVEEHGLEHDNTDQHIMVNGIPSKRRGSLPILVENERLEVPVLSDDMTDSTFFMQLRMFYIYLKIKRGIVELIIPRSLVRIDFIKTEKCMQKIYNATSTLDCGQGLSSFYHPWADAQVRVVSEQVLKLPSDTSHGGGLELVQALDRSAIGDVIMAAPLASLVFVIVWLSLYLGGTGTEGNNDVQAVVSTAFSVASYLVTAGTLVTALVAYLDYKPRDNEAPS